ncbi:hypothetical protein MRX96_004254 [Rhipicephalus microplus]
MCGVIARTLAEPYALLTLIATVGCRFKCKANFSLAVRKEVCARRGGEECEPLIVDSAHQYAAWSQRIHVASFWNKCGNLDTLQPWGFTGQHLQNNVCY